ncbi:MAG: hypothetical protein IMZ67_08995 [Acidobacteria bacterium]|nr:hypothetical protein [Acidobacteriota bacterium]
MRLPAMIRHPVTIDGETAEVGTAAELALTLDVLQGRHDLQVLEQLRPHLAGIIADPRGLMTVLASLAPDDQTFLIDALGGSLGRIVGSAAALREILAMLAEVPVEERLMEVIGRDGLRSLIMTAEDLAGVLEWVYGQCDRCLIDLLGREYTARLFQNGHEVSLVLRTLDQERQEELVGDLGWDRLASLVHDRRDLAHLMRALPPDASRRLLEHFPRERLSAIVANQRQWEAIARYLDAGEMASLRQRLEGGDHAS